MENRYKDGIVRDIKSGQIVGYNLSPDLYVSFTEEDIDSALRVKAKQKLEQDEFLSKCNEITKRINSILGGKQNDD